jgi:DNA primase
VKYSQEALEEMADQVDLLEYASHTVDFVKHSGATHYAVCPFHCEKTASLAVQSDDNFFHCFGCGRSGNIYTWIQLTEHLTFDQAVQKVANITNSDINDYVESESMSFYKLLNRLNNKKRTMVERTILNIDTDYNQKYKNEIPQEWLDEGISTETMKKYEIRIDPYSNRIVYPVRDANFQMIGVKGRTRFKDYKELGIMKYMNYNKLKILDYFTGMMQAADDVKKSGEIIIVEGLKSVMKLDQWGFHNVVSAETSTLNEYQIELLIKMQVKNVVIAFDKDVKLKKVQDCVKLLKKFTNVYVVYDKWHLLKDKDSPPDEGESVWKTLYNRRIRIE